MGRVLELAEVDTATALFGRETLAADAHLKKMRLRHDAEPDRVSRDDLEQLEARTARLAGLTHDFQMARDGDAHVRIVPRGEEVTLTSGAASVTIVLPADAQVAAKAMLALGKAGFDTVEKG